MPVFAYWLAIIRDSYAQAKINLGWFRWRIPLQTCQSRLFLCESQEFIQWLMHKITFAKIYQGNISKCASLFYTKRLCFPSPILGQTCLLAHRRWGIDVSRNVPQRRWARRNVCFRRLIPGKTDWSYLPFLADRMREFFSEGRPHENDLLFKGCKTMVYWPSINSKLTFWAQSFHFSQASSYLSSGSWWK